jgi:hypothetical protein
MVVFGLPLSAAALAVDFAVRRWVRRLAWLERAGLWVGVLAGGSLAILGGRALIDQVRFERDAKAAVRNLDFKPYATEGLPDGLTEQGVHADDYLGTPVMSAATTTGRALTRSPTSRRPERSRSRTVTAPCGDVLVYFDSLRPIAPGDIDFKKG